MPEPLWIFAYGSLIWNPGFAVAEARLARATGWRRCFCMRSIHYRGSEAAPGLVLALDRDEGAECAGLALRAAPGEEDAVLAMVRARELISSAYEEARLDAMTGEGPVRTITYVIDRAHPQYWGGLSLAEQAAIIARARGDKGPNRDYLHATAERLRTLGIADTELDWLDERVRALAAGAGGAAPSEIDLDAGPKLLRSGPNR